MHLAKRFFALLFSVMLVLTVVTNNSAFAQSTSVSVVNPSTANNSFFFYTNTTQAGFRFNATARVTNVNDLFAYQVYLTYNATLLNAKRAWLPKWDTQWVFYGKSTVLPPPAFKTGAIQIGDVTLSPPPRFSGSGLLAIIEFEILSAPTELRTLFSDLAIDNVDTYLLNSDTDEIPAVKVDGYYRFVWLEPGLEVKPTKYVAVTKPETFNISVWLNNVTISDRFVSLEFKLRYNITLLSVTQVTEGLFLKQFGSTVFSHIELSDYVRINVTLSGSYPEGTGVLAIITFQSIYQDDKQNYTPLNLFDILLLDNNKNPVTPTTTPINGSYTILPKGNSLVTINVEPTSIAIGSNATIGGLVSANETKANVNVTIYYRLVGATWSNLTTVKTNSTGYYTYAWEPTNVGTFELKANWTGDASTFPAESDIKTLTVKKASSAITINVNPSMVTVEEYVTISGAVNVTRADIKVTIYIRPVGGTWLWLANVTTDSVGNYYYVWKTTSAGPYELYARWFGDDVTNEAASLKVALTVKKSPSTISISVPESILNGSRVTVSGLITPARAGVSVTVYHRPVGGNWVAKSNKTKSDGSYTLSLGPLQNGTYELYASWLGDENTQPAVSAVATLRVLLPSKITINLDRTIVAAGLDVTIIGTITPKKVANVSIYYKLNVTGEQWISLATVPTNTSGSYTFTWKTAKKTNELSETFEFKVSWPGDLVTQGAESNIKTVAVEKIPSILTIHIDSSTVTVGSNVTIFGELLPTKANVNITIFYKEKGTTNQFSLLTKTNSTGHYNYAWAPMKNATFELYAWWTGDKNTNSTRSDIVTLNVNRIKASITVSVHPENVTAGSNITISGTITPPKPNVSIIISFRVVGTQAWSNLTTVTTDSNGDFRYVWATTDSGSYELKAGVLGDETMLPAESGIKKVNIEASPPNVFPYILIAIIVVVAIGVIIYYKKLKKS